MTAKLRVQWLYDDGNSETTKTVYAPDPPLEAEDRIEAYDEPDSENDLLMKEWAENKLYPLINDGPCDDDEIDVLVTFLDDDPSGRYEQEFSFNKKGKRY